MRISYQVACRVVAGAIQPRVGHVGSNGSNDLIGDWCNQVAVRLDDSGYAGYWRNQRVIANHQPVGSYSRNYVAGCRAQGNVNVGQQAALRAGAGHQNLAAHTVGQVANVSLMAVASDDKVHSVIQLRDDAGEGGVCQIAFAGIDVKQRAALRAALMQQYGNGINALCAELGYQGIDGGSFIVKLQSGNASRCNDTRGFFKRHAYEGHFHAIECFDAIGGQQCFAGGFLHHVCRQPFELGTFKRHRRTYRPTLAAVGVRQPRCHFAAAVLQPEQFSSALVKLMVADRRKLKPDSVERFNRRLIMKKRRNQRRCPNQITSGYHYVQWVFLLQGGYVRR